MGFLSSKEQNALIQARKIRQNLYERVHKCKRMYSAAFSQINQQLKRRVLTSSAIQISDMIDEQQITTIQVVYIFIERTINVGVSNNYVFDEMFQQAVESALKCDQLRKQDQYKKKCWRPGMDPQLCYPPYYGVPTSVKQTMIMKGRQTHVGFVSKVNPLPDHDGLFMMMIRKMGLIPIARSNVPQACKTIETNNNIFGYSKNPWNNLRSCGGSSGGQSGMVSSYSTPIGFGSDIGGSIRIPATFTGLVALKPYNRYSRLGNCYYGKFSAGIPTKSQLCPITRTVQDSILAINFLSNPYNYKDIPLQFLDPFQKYLPLDMQKLNNPQKLKIGIVRRLKYAKCSKANERALQNCVQILKSKGHQLVQVNFDKIEKLYFIFVNLFVFDQNLHLFSQFKGSQPLTVEYKLFIFLSKIPWLIKRIIMWFISKKEPRLVQMLRVTKPLSGVKVLQKIYQIQKVYSARVYKTFAQNKLDAVVLPTFVTPAPKLGQAGNLQYFFSFTAVWNVLHYPAGTIPVTVVRQDQKDFNDEFNDFYTKNVRKQLKDSEGLPIGVQIASTPYNEQKILYLMKQLQEQIKFRQKHKIRE